MNKKLAVVLAAMGVLGATTAFAANPFSDVTPQDWAYQAVSTLAAQGVIDGYPDGTFKGERNMTRYEMAQMVARAMARQDMANAEQQAQIDRLAAEFANELNSLGVRVSALEDRVGNVKLTGDARVRFQDSEGAKSKFDMRARLQFNANVSDKTNVVARVSTGNFGSGQENVNLTLDRLYVQHKFDFATATVGRYGEKFGATGYWFDDAFDGAKVAFGVKGAKLAVGYGTYYKGTTFKDNGEVKTNGILGDTTYVQLGYNVKQLALDAFYLDFHGKNVGTYNATADSAWGVGVALPFAEQFKLSGEYVELNGKKDVKDVDFWMARLDFGKVSLAKPGSWGLFVDYVDAEDGSYFGGTSSLRTAPYLENVKGWGVGGTVVLAKNLKLEALRTFNSETQDGKDVKERTVAQLVYKF